jgi:flagellar motor switch protein FliN/FliY
MEQAPASAPMGQQPMMGQPMMQQPMMGQPMMGQPMMGQPVNVQPAQFTAFSPGNMGGYQPENIDLIMDVPLEVTVELGRTTKSISDILDFGPGKIIELNKIAGEPIDVLVNGKYVAKGEVVVIEESFGVRITEIVNSNRLGQ